MNASEFLLVLSGCAPSIENLSRFGYPPGIVAEFHGSYFAKSRAGQEAIADDPLLDLVTRYDASSITIGMVKFSARPFESEIGWIVGNDEAELILIERESGEVQVRETGKEWYVASRCAATSAKFLDSMALVACFSARCLVDPELDADNEGKRHRAAKCAALAGGEQYLAFYENALGVRNDA